MTFLVNLVNFAVWEEEPLGIARTSPYERVGLMVTKQTDAKLDSDILNKDFLSKCEQLCSYLLAMNYLEIIQNH